MSFTFFLSSLVMIGLSQENSKYQSVYYQQWCKNNGHEPGTCEYLDDKYCQKVFPASYDVEFKCPNRYESSYLNGYVSTTNVNNIKVDETALSKLINPNFYITLILIRRNETGHPFYKYMSNGHAYTYYQPWSSSKAFAIINAGSTQRQKCKTPESLGLNSYENNYKDMLGDLATIIHSYGSNPSNFESNCLAYYFLNVGGREQLDNNLHNWLGTTSSCTLGGDYGCTNEYGLGYSFTLLNNSNDICPLSNTKFVTIPNSLNTLTQAEFYKRLVMVREEPEYSYPYVTWDDVKQLMYGPVNSSMFPGIKWGAGSTDTSWYIQSGTNITNIQERSNGQWRIFSKLGAGNTDIVLSHLYID